MLRCTFSLEVNRIESLFVIGLNTVYLHNEMKVHNRKHFHVIISDCHYIVNDIISDHFFCH